MDAINENQPKQDDALWKQYALYVDLFKFYINAALRVSLTYYAVTAAIIAFEFALPGRRNNAHLSLLFPALFGLVLSVVFWYGVSKAQELQQNVDEIGRRLELIGTAHISVLVLFLRAAAVLFFVVSGILFACVFRLLETSGGFPLFTL